MMHSRTYASQAYEDAHEIVLMHCLHVKVRWNKQRLDLVKVQPQVRRGFKFNMNTTVKVLDHRHKFTKAASACDMNQF